MTYNISSFSLGVNTVIEQAKLFSRVVEVSCGGRRNFLQEYGGYGI